ncbi:MAG: DnaD domain protein [Eubacteriales bacterium]|nr:DnaD domain protein [Eubacteriales bacterium]
MSMITLQTSSDMEFTLLSNSFIDRYMPQANGEFVKVYIYLSRILSSTPDAFSLEEMADRLLCTERDILRALKYWEKENLLTLSWGADRRLTGITLQSTDDTSARDVPNEPTAPKAAPVQPTVSQSPREEDSSPDEATGKPSSKNHSLTPDRVKELKKNEDIIQLLYIAEQYLGKTLTPTEMQKILFFYDELKLSADLIEYLLEYCVTRSHKSMRYIETVALAWAQEGITTVNMAKEASSRHSKEYYLILKAMGISGRNPVDTEISLMDTWMKEYGFTMDLIQEACSRTVLQTGQPSFQYADKILSGWKKKNVKSMDDIRTLDAEHKKRKLEKETSRPAQQPKSSNRFNNFHQREYDFDEYEKHLLNQ